MNDNTRALAAIEQSLLTHVETTHQQLVDAAASAGKDPTGDECLAMGTYHNHVISSYVGLLPTAQLLSEAGLTKLAERLAALIAKTRQASGTWFIAVAESWNHHIPQAAVQAAPAPPPAAPPVPAGPSAAQVALQQQQAHFQELERLRAEKQAQFDAWKKQHDEQQAIYDKQNADWAARFSKK